MMFAFLFALALQLGQISQPIAILQECPADRETCRTGSLEFSEGTYSLTRHPEFNYEAVDHPRIQSLTWEYSEEADGLMDPFVFTYGIRVEGRLDGATGVYLLTFNAWSANIPCGTFGDARIIHRGTSESGNPIILTVHGEFEITSPDVEVSDWGDNGHRPGECA